MLRRAILRWILRVLDQQSQNERLDKQDFTELGALLWDTWARNPGDRAYSLPECLFAAWTKLMADSELWQKLPALGGAAAGPDRHAGGLPTWARCVFIWALVEATQSTTGTTWLCVWSHSLYAGSVRPTKS